MVFVFGMFGGVFVIYLAMKQRSEALQLQHRERMAMIERGQVPLPDTPSQPRGAVAQSRALSIGIIIIGLGLALMTLVSVAGGSPEAGVGVGGAIVIIGAAFVVRSLVVKPQGPQHAESSRPLPPALPPEDRI